MDYYEEYLKKLTNPIDTRGENDYAKTRALIQQRNNEERLKVYRECKKNPEKFNKMHNLT